MKIAPPFRVIVFNQVHIYYSISSAFYKSPISSIVFFLIRKQWATPRAILKMRWASAMWAEWKQCEINCNRILAEQE